MTRTARTLAWTFALSAASAFGAGAFGAAELPPGQRHVMDIGHADVINVRSEQGELRVDVKDDAGEAVVHREPGEVLLHAKPESELAVPDLESYRFLGEPGDPVWVLPEVADPNLLWPGWETEEVDASQFPAATLTWRLLDVRGPGEVSVFVSDPLGQPIRFLDTGDPLPQETPIHNRSHTHANWAFEAEGLYVMTIEIRGERADGQTVSSGPIDYHWFVGDLADLPPDAAATTLTIAGLEPAYVEGETATLTAQQMPDSGERDVRWTMRCPGAPAGTHAGTGTELRLQAQLTQDGCAVRAELRTSHGTLHATSEPVTLEVEPASTPGDPPLEDPPVAPGAAPPEPAGPAPALRRLRARVSVGDRARDLARTRRAGFLAIRCRLDAAGTCRVRAVVGGRIAHRLGLPRRRTVLGTGRAQIDRPGEAAVRVRLTRSGRAALRAARRRLGITLIVTATAPGRPRATTSATVTLTRRPPA